MQAPKNPPNESSRIQELLDCALLDTAAEKIYDDLTLLAAQICKTPIALVSIVDRERQWFKSKVGLAANETPRDVSFCGHVVQDGKLLHVPDATKDARFADNPLVVGKPNVIFYVGAPLTTSEGHTLGTLCVIDHQPRQLDEAQISALETLARQATMLIEHRRLSQEVARTTYQLNAFFQISVDAMSVGTPDAKVQRANPAFCAILGYDEAELNGKTFAEVTHPDDVEPTRNALEKLVRGEPLRNFEIRNRRKDGSYVLLSWSSIFDPTSGLLYSSARDVSQDRDREHKFELAQATAKIGSWEYNLLTQQQYWSKEHYRIFEIPENQPAETLFTLSRSRIHPEDIPALDKIMQEALSQGKSFTYNHRVVLDRGSRIKYVRGIGRIRTNEKGEPVYMFGTCQDLTEETVLRNALDEEKTKSLQTAKLALLGEMSAGIAHEINNPLMAISGNVELLPKTITDEQKTNKKLENIRMSVLRIQRIVNGLKKFSRSSEHSEQRPHKLSDIVQECVVLTEAKRKKFDVSIDVKIESEAMVMCNEIEIEQVVVNLINNAVDAIKDFEDRWIRIEVQEQSSIATISLIDSGKGIPIEIRDKIFNPFFTTKDVGEGTGLGLSIARGIIEEHNGKLEIVDGPNTCFQLRFKRHDFRDSAA